MEIKKNKKNIKIPKLNYNLILTIIFYVPAIAITTSWIGQSYFKNLLQSLPANTKTSLKDSLFYKFYASESKIQTVKNLLISKKFDVDKITIDIKQKNLNKLANKRIEAIKDNVLISEDSDFVDAVVTYKNNSFDANLRLKGDWTDHLTINKPSFRIKLKGDNTLLGMNKFSIHHPAARNYLWEWVYHELLKNEKLPSIKYLFKEVIINGSSKGIYAVEQHFDKIVLESNKYKEAPILKFSEDRLWQQRKDKLSDENSYNKSFTSGFKLKKIKKNKNLYSNFLIGSQILNGIQTQQIEPKNAFDIKLLANYMAITDLTNSYHANYWHNIRFYYDPFQSRLIPIGFDGMSNLKNLNNLSIQSRQEEWINYIFKDKEFNKAYIEALDRVSKKEYIDEFLEKNKLTFNENSKILFKSYPEINTNPNFLYQNQKIIRKILSPNSPLNLFLKTINNQYLELDLANIQSLPIEVFAIEIGSKTYNLEKNKVFLGQSSKNDYIYQSLKIPINSDIYNDFLKKDSLNLKYRIYGLKKEYSNMVNLFQRLDPKNINKYLMNTEKSIIDKNYLKVDEINKIIKFNKKTINLKDDLIIPSNYTFLVSPGTKIVFSEGGSIISKSPIYFVGEEKNPITISSLANSPSSGIAVINAKKKSFVKNVFIKNLSSIERPSITLTGALTFYQSPVEIESTNITSNKSEDSINIVKSDFSISNSKISNSSSDALDIDFSNGYIKNLFIDSSGNDGLDISNSKLNCINISINNSGDKAFSVGESSTANIKNIFIRNANVGIANKDSSNVRVTNASIQSSKFMFAGFKKKNEYGGSKMYVYNLKEKIEDATYLLGSSSMIRVDDVDLDKTSADKNIYTELYE